ncbi:MAG: SDR family NAD(P)-dependent oxidoreductase [Firmicutes bacterium]|nr:SDR family NAD(P)-dependent oxidoreductase [Bacillota bacterium]
MRRDRAIDTRIWFVTPFERPDAALARASAGAGAFPVLHLGHDRRAAERALGEMAAYSGVFGVCASDPATWDIELPPNVRAAILPWGARRPETPGAETVWLAASGESAEAALAAGAKKLILKGAESAGLGGDDSAFILFQKMIGACKKAGAEVYVMGGVGVHTAAAYMALGAAGVVLDSQLALFPECGASQEHKAAVARLSGNEIRELEGFRYYIPFGSHEPASFPDLSALYARAGAENSGVLPLGQDVILSADLADEYKRLKYLVRALGKAVATHVRQARIADAFAPGGGTAKSLGTAYPIAQGPMARISDEPAFLRSVAEGGALPFLAMSMMTGEAAESALARTKEALGDMPWGVGILGFTYPKTLEEQTKLILEAKPPFVLIAGGRPEQGKTFEQAGIQVLLHAPTPGAFDMFLKESLTQASYIFEGRESGGHDGPLFSAVLWEKQINRILKSENAPDMRVFFAGGVHDALSAAFVRVAAGPLCSRGARVGLLCGTGYLYTEEAVRDGAITAAYQKLIIEKDKTLLLRSGSGQETRCVSSPFTDFFLEEKARMEAEGLPQAAILQNLENLNLGRLRIASKGLERDGGELKALPEGEQLARGLYMTGAVTELTDKTTAIAALHVDLTAGSLRILSEIPVPEASSSSDASRDIAVIGMAGIYPGAADADEFWRNVVFGRNCITEVPEDRWPADVFYDPEPKDTDHVLCKWGGFVGKTDFDCLEFGITPQSMTSIESVQLLSLLVAKRALQDAGIDDPASADLEDTTVIFGAEGAGELTMAYTFRTSLMRMFKGMPKEADENLPRLTEDSFPGILSNVIAGRISNRLNTRGNNYTVDAACASSLAALDIAVTDLRDGKAGMVVLGGADLHDGAMDFQVFGSTYALSKKGRCATFDSEADGIVISEGIGAIVLKRREDAEADGDRIYAVIKGIGGSSDGKSLALTAPSKNGQILALERAYESAGVRPSEVGMIEPHGTGTVVGDRIELQALSHVFWEDGARPGKTALSSLKSLIGHTKCASGMAGLIKAIYCVRHGVLPPTLHLKKPSKVYAPGSPFVFRAEKAGYWRGERRIAGVSGFGFGGTNFHAVVENYGEGRPETTLRSWPAELFLFPGGDAAEAEVLMDKVRETLEINDSLRLVDISCSLAAKSGGKDIQYAIVAGSADELLSRMDQARNGAEDEFVYKLKPVPGKVAFLFPGQGSQRVNMAADLFNVFPSMRRLLDGAEEYEDVLFPPSVFTDEEKKAQRELITDTRNAQPLLGIADLAIAELLKDFGVEPDMAAGHSYGELPALCFAGAIAPEDLVPLSRARAGAIMDAVKSDPGRMAAVITDRETLAKLLEGETDVRAVNYNAPRQTVVAGTGAGMDAFLKKAEAAGVPCNELNVACAFHSPLLKGADGNFAASLEKYALGTPSLPVMSNTDAGLYPDAPEEIKERLAAHLVNPVRFTEEIENMSREGAAVFVEAGPGRALTALVSEILKDKNIAVIQTERGDANGLTFFLQGLAKYAATGRAINADELFRGRGARVLDIDEPRNNRKKGIIWKVDGRGVAPENAVSPDAQNLENLSEWLRSGKAGGAAREPYEGNADKVVLSYLDNMNALIKDHRDVIMGYLGAADIEPRAEAPRRRLLAAAPEEEEAAAALEAGGTPEENGNGELPDIGKMTSEQITAVIFDIVSEKTGYPVDMLTLDTDLEADLSIDSIKKMEIIGGLRSRIKMPVNENGMEAYFEKIISVRKFRDLTAWVEELGKAEASGAPAAQAAETVSARLVADLNDDPKPRQTKELTRLTYTETPFPITERDESRLAGKSFALTDDGGGLARAAAERLKAAGAEALVLDTDEQTDLSGFDGLILINSAAGTRRYTVMDQFGLLKRADMGKLRWAVAFDDVPASLLAAGDFGEALETYGLPQGFRGLMKSLGYEYPNTRFGAVQFDTPFDPETFADTVADELADTKPLPELFYRDNQRFFLLPDVNPLGAEAAAPGEVLDAESVVVVLGGAQGITSHVVARYAMDVQCRYILAGRSADDPEYAKYAEFETVDEIRKYLITHENMKQPREIEAKAKAAFKSSRIAASVARFEKAGARAEYMRADATDPEAFGALLAEVRAKYGKIDGVIHAAGILEDKLFRDKEADSFARVYNTKAAPLAAVLAKALPELKLLVMFSSMSSAFGNAGQCDYSAGNSALDSAAQILKKRNPALRAVAFDWGPWRGAGMVNESLENEFNKRGISLIELDRGGEFFADELARGDEPNVLAMAIEPRAVTELLEGYLGSER